MKGYIDLYLLPVQQMMVEAKPLANMKQMRYGGFETFVSAS